MMIVLNIIVSPRYTPPTPPLTRPPPPPTTPRTYIRPSVRSLEHHLPGSDNAEHFKIMSIKRPRSWPLSWWLLIPAGLRADRVRDQQQQHDDEEEELATPWWDHVSIFTIGCLWNINSTFWKIDCVYHCISYYLVLLELEWLARFSHEVAEV